MKKFKYSAIILFAAIIFAAASPAAFALDDPELRSNAVVLTDISSGRTFFSKNADMKAYPASLTKVMTVLLAIEAVEDGRVSLQDEVTASSGITFDLLDDGSTAGIVPGETMTLENLLYCAILASANEACNVIAEFVGGSVPEFVEMMNQRASALGCLYTKFSNTHGLPNEEHYTTAEDFALISKEAVSHPLFMEICNTKSKTVPATNLSDARELESTNALLHKTAYYPDYTYGHASGVKTGYTSAAGYCLVSTASKDGVNLLAVVMGGLAYETENGTMSHSNFTDSIALYEWVFNNFSFIDILKSSELITEVPVDLAAGTDSVLLRPDQTIRALLPNDIDPTSFEREVIVYSAQTGETLTAPFESGTVLGEIRIMRDGEIYGSAKLVANSAVDISRSQFIKAQIKNLWDQPLTKLVFWLIVLVIVGYTALVVRYRMIRKRHVRSKLQARRAREEAENEAYTKKVFTAPLRMDDLAHDRRPSPGEAPEKPANAPGVKEPPAAQRDYFEEFLNRKD